MKPFKAGEPSDRTQAVASSPPSRVVPKPVPSAQARDPRGYQISQLRRRFSPAESTLDDGTTSLVFKLKPSDPDFAFDLDYLECDVRVPEDYPEATPALHVRNKNIPRGFGINIEKGWDALVEERKGATLLSFTNALDKNLETFLSEQKAETVKLVSFKDTRHLDQLGEETSKASRASQVSPAPAKPQRKPYVPEPFYTKEEVAAARVRRAQETRQLEARMGRELEYRKSADGVVYTLPIEPRKRWELPEGLQAVRTVHLIIPLLYPLQPLRAQLNEAEPPDAEPLEELFSRKAAQQTQMSLMSHLNYLVANIHVLAKMSALEAKAAKQLEEQKEKQTQPDTKDDDNGPEDDDMEREVKSHVKVIPRPPEWAVAEDGGDEEGSDSDDSYEYDSDSDGGAAVNTDAPNTGLPDSKVEKGTAMSFPSIELYGVELLQVFILGLNVKCARCKTINDIPALHHGVEKSGSCKKCANPFAVKFVQQLVHQNSTRAALIDVGGCTVADMLPSTLVPVCAKCSTASPGLLAVRGDTTTNVCRECHAKFSFKIPEVKFLYIAPGSLLPAATGPKKKTEKLGIHAGEPLPGRGACPHYKKSHRWFRFSCCSKVHPCDKCHDEAEDHINEWANRMICGWCSREQNYAVEACGFCGRSVIGKRGKGFWEGGKGTRDRTLMSRKDNRKYKRMGGGASSSKKE